MTAAPAVTFAPGDRVLVTRLDFLGDIILSLTTVDAVAARWPGVEIDFLARRPGADVLAGDARFGRVFALDRSAGLSESLRLVRALRARRYRAVVDLYSNPRSAWLCRLTGAPVRVGGDRGVRRRLYTHPVTVPAQARAALAHHLEHARVIGVDPATARKPGLATSADEREAARRTLDAAGCPSRRPRIGLHPGAKWSVKRWPAASFARLGELLAERLGATVVVFTGPGEESHTEAVRSVLGEGAVYPGTLGIRELGAVIETLEATVACDGGVMHLSVALGTPTVGIFGSAEPEVWFPYQEFGPFRACALDVDCRPCHRHVCPLGHTNCLERLTPESVYEVVEGLVTSERAEGPTGGAS